MARRLDLKLGTTTFRFAENGEELANLCRAGRRRAERDHARVEAPLSDTQLFGGSEAALRVFLRGVSGPTDGLCIKLVHRLLLPHHPLARHRRLSTLRAEPCYTYSDVHTVYFPSSASRSGPWLCT